MSAFVQQWGLNQDAEAKLRQLTPDGQAVRISLPAACTAGANSAGSSTSCVLLTLFLRVMLL